MSHGNLFLRPDDVVLFQGDSITNAFRMPAEINDAYQMGAGYAMMSAARVRADRPADRITFLNRGVSGNTIAELEQRWSTDCLDLKPTVLSILIGINDTARCINHGGPSPETYARRYAALLERTRESLPNVRFILLEPFGVKRQAVTDAWLADLAERQHLVRDIAAHFDARFVALQHHFNQHAAESEAAYWIYDGIHPTAAGHRLIADRWLEVVLQ